MSASEATPTVRRSTRERKPAKLYIQDKTTSSKKRKRDTDDEGGDATDNITTDVGDIEDEDRDDTEQDGDDESEGGDEYSAPKRKVTKPKKDADTSDKAAMKSKASGVKKVRGFKPKADGATRRAKTTAAVDVKKLIKDSHISDDNALFNAILNPSAALQSTVEEYLDSVANAPQYALADLVNCVLRACGCNESIDSDQVTDLDGVVDTLDTLTENLKQENAPLYPLVSKLPVFKKFHKQLTEFFTRLVASSAELGSLYTSDLLPTLLAWVVAMSSSQLRSLRHTATVIAMDMQSSLCEVAAQVEQEVITVARQREGEKKRAGKTKTRGREKDFESKAVEVKEREKKVAEYLDDFFDGVFVHRFRDHDFGIRAECVHAMGQWLKKYPTKFLAITYLQYIGWVLSDVDEHVRLASVKSLQALYASPDHIATLQSFTERFKSRLVQMATSDIDLSVRVASIQVLRAIDAHALLEEEQRAELCLLVYDEEGRVRRAVAGFVRGVWEEATQERILGRAAGDKEKDTERVGIKCLAELLVKWGKNTRHGLQFMTGDTQDEDEADESMAEDSKNRDVTRLVSVKQKGRIALVVEALWDEVPVIGDWVALLDHLLLDHSASDINGVHPSPRRAGKAIEVEVVDEAWRLTEGEEAALLELFVAALRKIREDSTSPTAKKNDAENLVSDMTRSLIKGLPRLFAKHQTDPNRVADVLTLPQLMNLELYLEMRMIPAYEGLWDDVIKQFTSHSSAVTLCHATATIQHLASIQILSNTNTQKILELEEELSTSLRDAVAGREELEIAGFSEDEVHTLGAITARLVMLMTVRDMTSWMEEDESGNQSSAWNIMNALAGRGRLGYKEEEGMVEETLRLLSLHLAWKARKLNLESEPDEDAIKYIEYLREQRTLVLEKLIELVVASDCNPTEGVKRAAFHDLLDLHILFRGEEGAPTTALPLVMDDETQYRCAGFMQGEIEQYVDDMDETQRKARDAGATTEEEASHPGTENESNDQDNKSDDNATDKKQKKGRGRPKVHKEDSPDPRTIPRSRLEREYILNSLLAAFIRAIRVGVLNPNHSAVVLAHFDRLGTGFNTTIKVIIDFLRDIGMFRDDGKAVSEIIVRALHESFDMFLDDVVHDDDHTMALAKALASCFVIRGAQLSIVRRLESQYVVEVHLNSIAWITKRLANYAVNNKRMMRKGLLFFQSLRHLLPTVESRDALKIKAHMDQAMAQAKIQVELTNAWDPYRAYEKRLMSKDKSIPATSKPKGKRSKKGAKAADGLFTSDDDELEVEDIVGDEPGHVGETHISPTGQTRPKARPKPRLKRRQAGEENPRADEISEPVGQPRVRSPSKRRAAQKVPLREEGSDSHGGEIPSGVTNGRKATPPKSRKRQREAESDHSDAEQENREPEPLAPPSPTQSHVSVSDIKNRRKRIRR